MSNNQNDANKGPADETVDTPELTDAELDEVSGAGYPQGENTPDYTRWGIGG